MSVSIPLKSNPLLTLTLSLALCGMTSARTWTNTDGKSIEADYISHNASEIVFAINGNPVTYSTDKLAQSDQDYLAILAPAGTPASSGEVKKGPRQEIKFTTHLFPKESGYYLDPLRKSVLTAYEAGTAGESAAGKPDTWLKRNPDKDTYRLYVPASYDATQTYGLLLIISAVDPGGIPEEWYPMLDELKLIAVCAENIGNSHPMLRRVQWSMDALANTEKEYRINPTRRFVAGTLGGGPAAMLTAAMYPGHFAGALSIGAEVKAPTDGTASNFPGLNALDFKGPQRSHVRWAALSGSGIRNHDKIAATSKEWETAGLSFHLLDLPGATIPPTAEQMKQAVTWLETGK